MGLYKNTNGVLAPIAGTPLETLTTIQGDIADIQSDISAIGPVSAVEDGNNHAPTSNAVYDYFTDRMFKTKILTNDGFLKAGVTTTVSFVKDTKMAMFIIGADENAQALFLINTNATNTISISPVYVGNKLTWVQGSDHHSILITNNSGVNPNICGVFFYGDSWTITN